MDKNAAFRRIPGVFLCAHDFYELHASLSFFNKVYSSYDSEITAYCNCFKRVFYKEKDPKTFQNEFSNTCIGYSLHSLLLEEDGRIVGGYTGIPMMYDVNGEEIEKSYGE